MWGYLYFVFVLTARLLLVVHDRALHHNSSFWYRSFPMESETKKQKRTLRFSEILRCLFYAVVVVFLLSCMVFQAFLFMDHLQTKQRLAAMDKKMNTFELTLKKPLPSRPPHTTARDDRLDGEDLHVRLRRAVTISLQSLEKRLKVLETRYDYFSESLIIKLQQSKHEKLKLV